VATGVKHFKSGNHEEALRNYNHSLEIDKDNVEALVARGALYANHGLYDKGIADFESALTINHTHSNAKKYLVETQSAYGQKLERNGELKLALRCYREALADNPNYEPARSRARVLKFALELKVCLSHDWSHDLFCFHSQSTHRMFLFIYLIWSSLIMFVIFANSTIIRGC
jgi:tetratricopeptide (TPR) repeat protein